MGRLWGSGRRKGRLTSRALTLLTALVLLLSLAACNRQQSTPTPTSTPAPAATPVQAAALSPLATPDPTEQFETHQPLVLKDAVLTPTPTATLAPTDTPAPTPTPTPSATPFPPGPPSKLGLFVGRNDPQMFDLLETGNVAVIKTLEYDPNFVAQIKRVSPGTMVVARYTPLPHPDFDHWDPIAEARAFVELLLPIALEPSRLANIDCWEAYNEPAIATAEQMASFAQFEAERTRLLAAAGVRSCIGNFSTGQPPLELWPAFFPALVAARDFGGYLSLHEYSAPYLWFGSGSNQLHETSNEGDEGWLTLRYRKVYRTYLIPNDLAVPLVITEAGIDGQVGNRPGPQGLGWRDFGSWWREQGQVSTTEEGFYVEQLAWYDAELAKDAYVIGATIYALAGPAGWQSFEIGGKPAEILEQYFSVHPPGDR